MDAAIAAIVSELVKLGLAGIVIIGLAWWINRTQKRNDELTDKFILGMQEQAKAAGETAAALNRIADSISRGKPE